MSDHYFTATPATPESKRTIRTRLIGRDVEVVTARGVFSVDHLDRATKILLDTVPPPPQQGRFLDLGCGWGPIALSLAMQASEAEVVAVDVNERARGLTSENAAALGLSNVRTLSPEEVPTSERFDLIWSNPPIRIGKEAVHDMLRRWLGQLSPEGIGFLVVSKNLGADSLAAWLGEELGCPVQRVNSAKGFRVLQVGRPTA